MTGGLKHKALEHATYWRSSLARQLTTFAMFSLRLALAVALTVALFGTLKYDVVGLLRGGSDHDHAGSDNICENATIAWQGFSTHARLNPTSPDAQIWQRVNTSPAGPLVQARTKLQRGDEDVIVVRYDIWLTHDDLQDLVEITQDGDKVALTVGSLPDPAMRFERCVKVDSTVLLPGHVKALSLDIDLGAITIVDSLQIGRLSLRNDAGALRLDPKAVVQAEAIHAELRAGSFAGHPTSMIAAKSIQISSSAGAIAAQLEIGRTLTVAGRSGSIGLTLVSARGGGPQEHHKIDIKTYAGAVHVDGTGLTTPFDLKARSRAGAVSARLAVAAPQDGRVGAELRTQVGSIHAPSSSDGFVLETARRGHVRGYYGPNQSAIESSVELTTGSGPVALVLSHPTELHVEDLL